MGFLYFPKFILMVLYCRYYETLALISFRHIFINLFNNYFNCDHYSLVDDVFGIFSILLLLPWFSKHYCANRLIYLYLSFSGVYISRNWMAESRETNLFSFIGYCQIAFQSSSNLHTYQQCVWTSTVLSLTNTWY